MLTFVILGFIFAFFIKRLMSKLEYRDWDYMTRMEVWKPVLLPLWAWLLITFGLCLPIIGVIAYIIIWIYIAVGTEIGDLRFKKDARSLLKMFIEILKKKY